MWVVRDILKSKSDIQKMLTDAEKAQISDLFVQVRGRADAYYKSELVTLADGLDGSFDPFEYLLTRSKGKYRIHAWINVFYLWSSETNPAAKQHLLYTRPEWSAVSSTGTSMISEGLKSLKEKNMEGYYISPASDAFQEYFLKVTEELIDRYPLDGIHLDYIRFAGKDYDYSESMRAKFLLNYHVDPFGADSLKNEKKEWFEKTWSDFRRGEITRFVEKIGRKIRSVNKDIVFSAAVWADMDVANNEVLQEWPKWLKQGYLDLAVPMNYATDNKVFERRIRDALSALGDSVSPKRIVMGISLYNQNAASMYEKLEICRKFQLIGISFFSYETVRKDKNYFQKVVEANY
jgi:uncharacterized lipoprotein YddW (UPF0748 family)